MGMESWDTICKVGGCHRAAGLSERCWTWHCCRSSLASAIVPGWVRAKNPMA